MRLEGGRTRVAQVYPEKFCKAICAGLQNHNEIDKRCKSLTMRMNDTQDVKSKAPMNVARRLAKEYQTVEEYNQ